LPQNQAMMWQELKFAKELGFVLYKGTAVCLRYGHRQSVDFDFFTSGALDKIAIQNLFFNIANGLLIYDTPNTLSVMVNNVKLSFFSVGFSPTEPTDTTNDGVLSVASPLDLLATKLKVILQRAEVKDYIDIATLLKNGVSLENAMNTAKLLYSPAFQLTTVLKALTYFDDGNLSNLHESIKEQLRSSIHNLTDQYFSNEIVEP
jgi:hypothetical protein